jgi:beta-barrel assembly-enhancing protease
MEATILDNLSAHPYPCQVLVSNQALQINYTDNNAQAHRLTWQAQDLIGDEFIASQPRLLNRLHKELAVVIPTTSQMLVITNALGRKDLAPKQGFFSSNTFNSSKGLVGLAIAAILLTVGFIGWVIPSLAEQAAMVVPYSWEQNLGNTLAESIIGTRELPKESKQLTHFYKSLGYNTKYPVTFHVVENSQVNAFALPGGIIIVHTAILQRLSTPEQLAALLGHELGHVQERHTMRGLMRSVALYSVVSMAIGDMSGLAALLIENGQMLDRMQYSRALEASADTYATRQMREQHLDLKGIVELFEVLKKAEVGNSNFPLLRSHPLTSNRLAYAKKEANTQQAKPVPSRVLQAFDSLKHGLLQ